MPRPDSGEPERPVGSLLRSILDQPRMRRGLALGRLLRSWEDVVGPELARETRPLALDEGGLLVGATSAAWATQVRFLAEEIRRRSLPIVGQAGVRSVRVIVRTEDAKPQVGRGFRPR